MVSQRYAAAMTMAYRKSNDNWKQLLIKLDEIGAKPFFIHLLVTRWTWKHFEYMRRVCSGQTPKALFYNSLKGCVETTQENDELIAIYNQLN